MEDIGGADCDAVTNGVCCDTATSHGIGCGCNEPSHPDPVGVALASAMLTWCNDRDVNAMRRVLLNLLFALEEA